MYRQHVVLHNVMEHAAIKNTHTHTYTYIQIRINITEYQMSYLDPCGSLKDLGI